MSKNQNNHATLESYAAALLQLGDERHQTDAIASDATGVAQLFRENDTFVKYAADPSVAVSERSHKLDTILGGRVSDTLLSFLKLLNSKDRLASFPEIAKIYQDLLDKRSGKIEVDVTVATALNDHELENVRHQVSVALSKNAQVRQHVDESIIGGLVLQIGDRLIDGSVKSQLETLRRQLLAATPA